MTDRGPNGKFVKGNKASPGRPKKATEEEYRDAVKDVIPLDRFIRQLEKLAKRADRGDIRALDKICGLLGLDVIKQEVRGSADNPVKITVEYVNNPITTPGIASRTGEN